ESSPLSSPSPSSSSASEVSSSFPLASEPSSPLPLSQAKATDEKAIAVVKIHRYMVMVVSPGAPHRAPSERCTLSKVGWKAESDAESKARPAAPRSCGARPDQDVAPSEPSREHHPLV